MAIALVGVTDGPTHGINSITPTIPAAQVTSDMMLLIFYVRPFNGTCTVSTAGWASLGSAASGSTATGIDAGSVKAEVWWKEATTDTETNPQVVEGATTWEIAGGVIAVLSKDVSETWETPVIAYAADETDGTSLSFTAASDPGVTSGDYIVLGGGFNSDLMGPLTGSPACLVATQTGVTFGAFTDHTVTDANWETTTGQDMSSNLSSAAVTAGTSSAAPVWTGTGTASAAADMAEGVFIRLRVSATSLIAPPDSGITALLRR